jgi:hypothetical protein
MASRLTAVRIRSGPGAAPAGPHQDCRRAQIERLDRFRVDVRHRRDEVGHHHFRPAENQIGILPRTVDPFRRWPSGHFAKYNGIEVRMVSRKQLREFFAHHYDVSTKQKIANTAVGLAISTRSL